MKRSKSKSSIVESLQAESAEPAEAILNAPRVKVGAVYPPFLKWYSLALLSAFFITFFTVITEFGPNHSDFLFAFLFFFGLFAIPGLLFVKFWKSPYSSLGIVTHLHTWSRGREVSGGKGKLKYDTLEWIFDMRLTDKNWRPLKGPRGFLLPVVTTEFRTYRVHGPPLEEGSPVVLRGFCKRGRVKAIEIWNLSPDVSMPLPSEQAVFWGRVTGWQGPRQTQDMRYPGSGHYLEIWSFRLQPTDQNFKQLLRDEEGNLLPSLPVEIRAQAISGSIAKNDRLEIHGKMVRGTLYTNEVLNHSADGAALVVKEWAGVP